MRAVDRIRTAGLLKEGERVRYADWPYRGRRSMERRSRDGRVLEIHMDDGPWAYWNAVIEFDDGTVETIGDYMHMLVYGGMDRL